ncbi:WD40 repeat-like protein, partial [Rickenella mellea]
EDIENFVKDAIKFVSVFGHAIAQSASHIYLSALPFAPKISVLAQHYLPQFSQNMLIQTGKEAEWPVLQHILEGHTDYIRSVAFSPDGKHIVSGSDDKTIRVWDAETGTVTLDPLEGHTERISSVAFSPNAKHIVSGS